MISELLIQQIEAVASRYPHRGSALLPALDMTQRANANVLIKEDIAAIASLLGVSPSKAYGVASYYTMYNKSKVGKYHLQLDTNIPATIMGAGEILKYLEKTLKIKPGQTTPDGLFTLTEVEDLGSCGTCPVMQVNDTYYENLTIEKVSMILESLKNGIMPSVEDNSYFGSECNILLKNRGDASCRTLEGYVQKGGYKGLEKARTMKSSEILDVVKYAIVRGRGGAGFPAGMKWGFLPQNNTKPVYLICNADEGEPGTFKDRQIMQYDPHLLVEGIEIAARAIQAKKSFIYIRGEFRWISEILENAIQEARQKGLLTECDIVVHRGAGSYECGEETALIESLEGNRGCPRLKPPFPAVKGLYGCPTIVNNVETLSCLPFVLEHGAEEFRKIGVVGNAGPKLFGVSGHVNKPGVYEYPLGTPLKKILEAAGGVKGKIKAVIVGGLSTPILTAQEAEKLNMDYDACLKAGTMLGSGGIIVINDTVSIPLIALRSIEFYAHESCGQCTPCREGSVAIKSLLKGLIKGYGSKKDIDKILELSNTIMGTTLCPTGDAFSMPIRAMVQKFRSEFEALVKK
ncbi:MAG: NADH-quinone oxidoreductase subunit NuoF [Candidatus Brocadiae bacterium]|nr:NADH-quinone oxidoreductase subunit NuoF [Candidatus Brocadiia bacterium]